MGPISDFDTLDNIGLVNMALINKPSPPPPPPPSLERFDLPACDARVGILADKREPTGTFETCKSKTIKTWSNNKEAARDECSRWYNEPLIGNKGNICDGDPIKDLPDEWVCQSGSTCKAP